MWAWVGAGVFAVLVLAILGYDLFGKAQRLRKAVAAAQGDLLPQVRALAAELEAAAVPETGTGRHRANPGIPDGVGATGGRKS